MRRLRAFLAIASALALSACEAGGDEQLNIVFVEQGENAGAADDGDSAFGRHRRIATQMGLVTFDSGALVRPGLAERWVISDDGLSYIFRLGDHSWADGQPVTTGDVAAMLERRLRSLRATPMGSELAMIGDVIARTDEILEVQLDAPVPRLLDLLASPELTLARRDEGLGPMTITEATRGGFYFLLPSPDDETPDGTVATGRPIHSQAMPPSKAVAAYQAGMADLLIGLHYSSVPLVEAANIPDDALLKDTAMGHFGIDILRDSGALVTPGVREAIAMSFDRPRILSAFGFTGWREVSTLSPPELTTRGEVPPPNWFDLSIADRKARARTRVAEAGLTGEEVTIFIADEGPGSALLFGLLRQDFADIGLRLERADTLPGAQMQLIDQLASFDDPLWYLSRLRCRARRLCDGDADALVNEARNLALLPDRAILLAEAEQRLMALVNFIPLAEPLRFSITRAPLTGLEPNFRALHPLQYLAARPDR